MDVAPSSLSKIDGRTKRADETRRLILWAARELMKVGEFRPSMAACCLDAGRSVRAGFTRFPTVEALHLEALLDAGTRNSIAQRVLGQEWFAMWPVVVDQVVRAIVTGRG